MCLIFECKGTALIGVGSGAGPNRAVDAATAALTSPLLDFPVTSAKGLIFNVVGGDDLTLEEVNKVAEIIYDKTEADANIIFGARTDSTITNGEVKIHILSIFNTYARYFYIS